MAVSPVTVDRLDAFSNRTCAWSALHRPRPHRRIGAAIAATLTFVWLGLVLAISFLEAPLKFRAPG